MAEHLTTQQVADRFHVHPQTVIDWANKGLIKHYTTLGGHRRFDAADVERLAQEKGVPEPATDSPVDPTVVAS